MNLFNPTALLKEGKILIEGYPKVEPKEKDCHDYFAYCLAYENWQASKVSYPLKDECKEEFKDLLLELDYNWLKKEGTFYMQFCKGISIDSIKHRIEIKEECVRCIYKDTRAHYNGCLKTCPAKTGYAILLPIQVEEKETPEQLWAKVINHCRHYNGSPEDFLEILNELKNKYVISRNN